MNEVKNVGLENRILGNDMQGFNQPILFFSNHLEKLGEHLKENLFAKDSDPFSQRWVIVPNRPVERWIERQLAQDPACQIACGMTTYSLSGGVEKLYALLLRRHAAEG